MRDHGVVPYTALRIVLTVLMRLFWRVRAEGLENVPRTGGAVTELGWRSSRGSDGRCGAALIREG